VVAVDPSSPFTGGAVLGDRIRMQAHTLDSGVFIRSMATRGSLGGLARATAETQKLLDAAGFDWVLVETVGVGQTELDVVRLADTTVVVLVPESGDGIQTMKAGLLEAADILVVNKADREGAARLLTELKYMVHLHREGQQASRDLDWEVPILSTEAVHDVGVAELLETIGRHRAALESSGALERRRQARRARELRALLVAELRQEVDRALADGGALERVLADVEAGRVDPHTAIRAIAKRLRLGPAASD
jgi:LAO/AO transport system kinase